MAPKGMLAATLQLWYPLPAYPMAWQANITCFKALSQALSQLGIGNITKHAAHLAVCMHTAHCSIDNEH